MRTLLILWLVPMSLLGVWYGLSVNDWNMGTRIFSRAMYDQVFTMYGNILGIEPERLPAMLAKTIVFDSLLILSIIAYRMRKSWWPKVSGWWHSELPANGQGSPAE